MIAQLLTKRGSPIGVDIGNRSVKLLQLTSDRSRIIEAARWDIPELATQPEEEHPRLLSEALHRVREGRRFRGRDAVVCLGARELFVQNIRVGKTADANLPSVVQQEASARLPYSIAEAEIRFVEAADIRHGDVTKREVIVLACHRPTLNRYLQVVQDAGLRPVAVDVEPTAVLRCYKYQFRREEDQRQRAMYLHIGATNTMVVIAQGAEALFIKYLDVNGNQMDEAVALALQMDPADASLLRRNNGDRRADQQDPEVTRSIAKATRPVLDRLANEVSLCIRYHSVTFRGRPLARIVLGGGEASANLVQELSKRLDMPCELGEPLRVFRSEAQTGRQAQWDIAAGLALRSVN